MPSPFSAGLSVCFYTVIVSFILFQAILAAVVIANLVGLLKQFSRFPVLWRIDKPDAVRFGSLRNNHYETKPVYPRISKHFVVICESAPCGKAGTL